MQDRIGGQMAKRVLVVEDSEVIQRLIEVCLRPAGFDIEMRSDGHSGIAAARDLLPDLIILDVGLPGIDGWEVLSRLRADENTANLTVLILTAHAQDETKARANADGADAFLSKPFRPHDLRVVAQQLIEPTASAEPATFAS